MSNNQLPPVYLELITPLLHSARKIMEGGEELHPVAFIGNLTTRRIMPVMFQTSSEEAKDRSSEAIRRAAGIVEADFIALFMESWGLPPEMVDRYEAIIARYGSIGASPYRLDIVTFSIETPHGLWMAQSPITPLGKKGGKGKSKGRTFKDPEFQLFTDAEGRFARLLPAREREAAGGLH